MFSYASSFSKKQLRPVFFTPASELLADPIGRRERNWVKWTLIQVSSVQFALWTPIIIGVTIGIRTEVRPHISSIMAEMRPHINLGPRCRACEHRGYRRHC